MFSGTVTFDWGPLQQWRFELGQTYQRTAFTYGTGIVLEAEVQIAYVMIIVLTSIGLLQDC